MITPQNRIIIVDDEQDELNTLINEFLNIGLGCRPFLYEEGKYNLEFTDVRLAFFDINITHKSVVQKGELSNEDFYKANSNVYNDLVNAINSFINLESGPFALIFWTNNVPLIEGFKLYVEERKIELAKPFYIGCIDKYEVKNGTLSEKLKEILENDKIKFYFEIEESARIAGSNTIDNLHKIIPKDSKWSDNSEYFNNIDKVLSKIAVNVLGYDYAKEKPLKGVYEGLSQLVLKEFLSQESQIDSTRLMSELENKKSKELSFPNQDIQAKLNSIYHISEGVFEKDYRGAVIELDKTNKELLKKLNIKDESIDAWFSLFIPFNNDYKALKKTVRNNSKLICCEISSACDFSNKKQRKNKYILGFITPVLNVSEQINEALRPESSYNVGGCNFWLEGEKKQIWFNLNYVFSLRSDSEYFGNVQYSLNKEIMDMIGNKYANHVSRIGITSF
jgi:hypothetical protein